MALYASGERVYAFSQHIGERVDTADFIKKSPGGCRRCFPILPAVKKRFQVAVSFRPPYPDDLTVQVFKLKRSIFAGAVQQAVVSRSACVLVAFWRIVECSLAKLIDEVVALLAAREDNHGVSCNPACAEVKAVVHPIQHVHSLGCWRVGHGCSASHYTHAHGEYADISKQLKGC